jgi:hypothetical protein
MQNLFFFSSIESDFIDVPIIPKRTEPIILPEFPSDDTTETSHNNTSSEFIELDDDESSHNSTAIEDIRMFINDDKDQPSVIDSEIKEPSISQLVRSFSQKSNFKN